MKTTSVSSAGISNALRYSQMRMQVDLVKGQKEMDTGRVADLGLALGARTAQSVTFARDLDRLKTIVDSNGLVASRLTATQNALSQLSDQAQTLLSSLMSNTSGDLTNTLTGNTGKATLQALTSILNTSVNGEFLFAGTNTDVKPISDFDAAGSPAKAAFNASFVAYFHFTPDDPAAAGISAAEMDDMRDPRRHRRIDAQLRQRPAIGLDADRRRPRLPRHQIDPRPGGVDQHRRLIAARVGLDPPAAVDARRAGHRAAQCELRPRLARARQCIGVERGDVDIGAARLPYSDRPAGAQPGNIGRGVDAFERHPGFLERGEKRLGARRILRLPDMQRPKRIEEPARLQRRPR